MNLVEYATARGFKHGTVKRWACEGMPVIRNGTGRCIGVDGNSADIWVKTRAEASSRFARQSGRESIVYFAHRAADNCVKIGFTRNWLQREKDFRQTRNGGTTVVLLGTIPGDKTVELAIHKRFAQHRIRGEWFAAAPDLLAFIASDTMPPSGSNLVVRHRHGSLVRGDANGKSRLTEVQATELFRRAMHGESYTDLAKIFNVGYATVRQIAKGVRRSYIKEACDRGVY